ncbi:MAG: suppressor of fused domain protein, partial [Oscillospiraceae bacterium]|nr:suppressor of fused domain protein [Oscillospiraceae bacterium]
VYGFTAGISHFMMPRIEMYVRNAEEHRRIEFGFAAVEAVSAVKMQAYNCFMSLAQCIHRDLTFFAHGHTNTWDGIPGFHAFLFVNTRALRGLPAPQYDRIGGDLVNLLWAVPITKEEYEFVVRTNINELMRRAKDITRVHIFDGRPKFSL